MKRGKKSRRLARRILLAVALAVLTVAVGMIACEQRTVGPSPPGGVATAPVDQPVPDRIERGSRREVRVFEPGNAHAGAVADDLAGLPAVVTRLAALEDAGYVLDTSEALVLEVTGPSGRSTVAFLPMAGPDGETSATLACIWRDGGDVFAAPALFRGAGAPAAAGFHKVAGDLWMCPGGGGPARDEARVSEEFWNTLYDCLLTNVPSLTVGCALTCVFVPGAYVPCMIVCVGTQSAVTLVQCAISAFMTVNGGPVPRSE